ncbi:hypothetical protein KP004_20635 [Geomonas oryzisoli]|uniref:Lipoprotein n=2 Tax=Geomonas oryzisoli TaxID=2847992 RepID=A0ABX8J8W8_9BACT|nr:hypothetical protein KP004_20635 [Geomonas oryzisoli]
MCPKYLKKAIMILLLLSQAGCANLLPRSKAVTESPWEEYEAAKASYDSITIGKTTVEDLQKIGFDIKSSPNIKILNYLDIAAMLQGMPSKDLDPGLQACLKARSDCRAYVFEPKRSYSKRVGNFWLDIFNFKRRTHETGWRFKALVVFVNHHVAYKLSSGEPKIDQMTDQVNPLGPFQAPADIFTKALF